MRICPPPPPPLPCGVTKLFPNSLEKALSATSLTEACHAQGGAQQFHGAAVLRKHCGGLATSHSTYTQEMGERPGCVPEDCRLCVTAHLSSPAGGCSEDSILIDALFEGEQP